MDIVIITDQNSESPYSGLIKTIAYDGTEEVFEDETEFILSDALYIKNNNEWTNLEVEENQTRILPFIGLGIGALLASILNPGTIATIAALLGYYIAYISYDELKQSFDDMIDDLFPDETTEPITSEYTLPGDVTIFLIDGVPTIVHWEETNEASYFLDFETEVRSQLDDDSYHLVCKIDDVMVISPIAFDVNTAEDIIDEDSPIYHIWTLYSYNAINLVNDAECHMFPFEIIACDVHYAHWHNCEYSLGVYYYSNSMAFFGLEYNAQDDDTYLDEDDL